MAKAKKNEPADRVRIGSVEVAIWENTSGDRTWRTLAPSSTYKDAEGSLKSSNSFSESQAVILMEALRRALPKLSE